MTMKKLTLFLILLFEFGTQMQAQEAANTQIVYGHNSFQLYVEVFNRENERLLDNVNLYLYEMPGHKLVNTAVTAGGAVTFRIDPKKEYSVESCKKLYLRNGINIFNCYDGENVFCANGAVDFDFFSGGGPEQPNAVLSARMAIDSVAVGKTFKLENVYYDLDKWYLRSSSKAELDRLYAILVNFPSMTVELSSHTDSRGSDTYNEDLSANRARACYEYLVVKGISPERIIPRGYGESKLVNNCADGVKCVESAHQKNRRTEFKVLSFEGEECVSPAEL